MPPAALAIHLSIGQVYAFSVFKIPLSRLIGGAQSTPGDWSLTTLAWIFSVAIVVLGLSAAIFGAWLERVGPRRAMFTAALCFGSGFWVAAAGVALHHLWLVVLGYGVLGGVGLGLGYISPVSTLIKWFPDRPGMATGMAIMGFGGGAMIAAPLSVSLMTRLGGIAPHGVAPTFLVLGAAYFLYMMFGVLIVRVPPPGWSPPVGATNATRRSAGPNTDVNVAWRTARFWLVWIVLCMNVTAGIGILEQASPMVQEMFKGRITAAAAAGYVSLLSLANMTGRFIWSSVSDYIGRKATYAIFFALGAALYASVPALGASDALPLFVIVTAVLLSMYGGGFATVPAYLRDLFGTSQVGAIHGRLLTAWSVAGVLGPLLVNHIRDTRLAAGVSKAHAYDTTMYVMAALLTVGFIANALVPRTSKDV